MKEHLKKFVPLYRVVGACAIDMYEDFSAVEERYYHWAARGLKKLNRESFRLGKQKALIPVSRNTKTATLPCSFERERFVGYLDSKGRKVAIPPDRTIADISNIPEEECVDKCKHCQQSLNICKDMELIEDAKPVVINGQTYYETSRRKLLDNGDYYEEIQIPVLDLEDGVTVNYVTQTRLLTHFDRKSCGCLEDTDANIAKVKRFNEEAYCCYYAEPCKCDESKTGRYRIFPETGLIQLSSDSNITKLYIEYDSFIPKVNGYYVVPEAAFETLVEWTKWKSIQNRKGVPYSDKQLQFTAYQNERKNMNKTLGRVSLSAIMYFAMQTPKFDVDSGFRGLQCR